MANDIFSRTELLLGSSTMKLISNKRVIIFGVGGVGSWCAESLIRSGISHLTIVDSDRVSVTNINRQLMATTSSVGKAKVEVLKKRLLDINPQAQITALQDIYSAQTANNFHLENYDYIIDAIDSLQNKVDLILQATSLPAKLFSSMGAALKLNPSNIHVTEFWKVKGCPLGAALRRRFKRLKQFPKTKFLCVYSDELLQNRGTYSPLNTADNYTDTQTSVSQEELGKKELMNHDWSTSKAQINGTIAHITAIFGFTLAGLVIQDIVNTRL